MINRSIFKMKLHKKEKEEKNPLPEIDKFLLGYFQLNLTRIFALTRPGVVRPRETCATPVRHFLAQRLCCRTFFSGDDGAITLPL